MGTKRNYFVVAKRYEKNRTEVNQIYLITRDERHIDICHFGEFIHSMTLLEAEEVLFYMKHNFKGNKFIYQIVDKDKKHIEY